MTTVAHATAPKRSMSPTASLVALGLGAAGGMLVHQAGSEVLFGVRDAVEPLGYLWLRALRMVVYPLVISTLMFAVLRAPQSSETGRLGAAALAMFVGFLCLGGLFSYLASSNLVSLVPKGSGSSIPLAPASADALDLAGDPLTFGDWLNSLIPTNPFESLAAGHLLPVIIFTIVLAAALRSVDGPARQSVEHFFEAIYLAMMTLVGWILVAAPAAIFVLALSFASNMGLQFGSVLLNYVVMECGLLVLAIALLYPVTMFGAGVSPWRFGRAVLPAQLVAISTRSSLASLPALLDGARTMGIRREVGGLVLPLAASVFKTNRPITSMFGFLFLAHLFGIDLSATQVLTFFVTTLVLSFSSVGIPLGGSQMLSLPAYLAAGIPIEGYLLLKTVDVIPDLFKTVINVTGDMSVATILNRYF